jgi:hypothetical protein
VADAADHPPADPGGDLQHGSKENLVSDLEMLSPQNCAIALIDFQPAMYQGVQSHDRLTTLNNVQVLAKAAKLFDVAMSEEWPITVGSNRSIHSHSPNTSIRTSSSLEFSASMRMAFHYPTAMRFGSLMPAA